MPVHFKLASFKGAQSLPASSMHLNDLSADSLLVVFHYLPIFELLQVPAVCRRWNALHETARRQRRSLLLLGDNHSAEFILAKKARIPLLGDRENKRLIRKKRPSSRASPATVAMPSVLVSSAWLTNLPVAFPSITSLYITLVGPAIGLHHIAGMLTGWQAILRRLHLFYDFASRTEYSPEDEKPIPLLMEALDSMVALRKVRLLLLPQYYHIPYDLPTFSLSLLSQLKFFDFHGHLPDLAKAIFKCLSVDAQFLTNSQLQIALRDKVQMEHLLQLNPQLDHTFVYLAPLRTLLRAESLSTLERFTARFTSLASLRLSLHRIQELRSVARCLVQLPALVDLSLYFLHWTTPRVASLCSDPPVGLPIVLSVRTLAIILNPSGCYEVDSHATFKRFHLAAIFPSVEILQFFAYRFRGCSKDICRYAGSESGVISRVDSCIQMAVALLAPEWSQLQSVLLRRQPRTPHCCTEDVTAHLTPNEVKQFVKQ